MITARIQLVFAVFDIDHTVYRVTWIAGISTKPPYPPTARCRLAGSPRHKLELAVALVVAIAAATVVARDWGTCPKQGPRRYGPDSGCKK